MALKVKELGRAGAAAGWRGKVADVVSGPVAKRTPLRREQVRVGIGLAFLALSAYYLVRTVRGVARG